MAEQRKSFPFRDFEPKWQGHWEANKTFTVPNPGDAGFDASKRNRPPVLWLTT
jgi:leucyl-tRNA synthetase